jgi:tetratricopeptide (TPR) repeat protein
MKKRRGKLRKQKQRIDSPRDNDPSGPGSDPPSHFASEQMLRDVHRTLEGKKFASKDELNSFLQSLVGKNLEGVLGSRAERHPKEKAQDLAYRALEAENPVEAVALAGQALELDPDCVDALAALALYTAKSREQYISNMQKAVEVGERSLGKDFFEENRGHFWGLLETRPYMRARYDLASALHQIGRVSEAVGHFEGLLELNPNDNQGVRYTLLGCYLLLGNLEGARRLLKENEEESSATLCWGRVLERYLSTDLEGASSALTEARKENPHVEPYLTGKKKPPRLLPEYYSRGDEDEAIYCMTNLGAAWERHPDAAKWLQTVRKTM